MRHWAHLLKKRGVLPPVPEPPPPAVHLVRVEATAVAAAAPPPPPPPLPATLTVELGAARVVVPAGFDAPTLRTVFEALGAGGRR